MNSDDSDKRAATPSARILKRVREDAIDLALLTTVTTHDWKLLSDKNHTQMYEMTGESLSNKVSTIHTFGKGGGGHPSEFYLIRAATTVRTDVNTMLDVLRTSTSEDFRVVMKKIFNKQFESGAIVDSLSCTTPPPYALSPDNKGGKRNWQFFSEDDSYSANWVTLRAFTKLGGLEGHRDFTMVCYQDVFERAHNSDKLTRVGRRSARDPHRPQPATGSSLIGVHTFSSMNFKDIPELPKSSKTDRLHFRNSGIIVEELVQEDADGPMVRVSLLLSLMPSKLILKEVSQSPRMRVALAAGHEVAKKYRKWLQTLALGVAHLVEAAKPIVTMQHLSKMKWTESDNCFLCLKAFRTYRRRHHCRFCGEAVCGSCSSFIDMTSFDVNYKGSEGSTESIEKCKLDLRVASDGSERNENESPNASRDNAEEFTETRGCNMCVSELQMNLTMLGRTRNQQSPSLYNNTSYGSLSQFVHARRNNRGGDHENKYLNNNFKDPPPPYPGRENHFERDQVTPMRTGDYQQYSQQKISFSTISSSSYSGLSSDEREKLAQYSSASTAEFMGKAPNTSISPNSIPTPNNVSAPDASLSSFLARDPDILALNGLTLSPGGSNMMAMDDNEHMDPIYNCNSASCTNNRASFATTAATNEGSNHSHFNFASMTPQEIQATERLIREAYARGSLPLNGRPPVNTRRYQPLYQPGYEQSPVELTNKKGYHMPVKQGVLSPSHSQKSSYSSGSTNSDLILLNAPSRSSMASSKTDFIVFHGSHGVEAPSCMASSNDMIPLKF